MLSQERSVKSTGWWPREQEEQNQGILPVLIFLSYALSFESLPWMIVSFTQRRGDILSRSEIASFKSLLFFVIFSPLFLINQLVQAIGFRKDLWGVMMGPEPG